MLITNKGWLTGLALLLSASSVNAVTDNEFVCGALEASFGPFDYRVTPIDRKQLVEGAHFTREVELLIRGNASGKDPLGDISYTLRAVSYTHLDVYKRQGIYRYGHFRISTRSALAKKIFDL